MRFPVALLLVCLPVLALRAEAPPAPFGLRWGAQPVELATLDLEPEQRRINLRSFRTTRVPVGLPDAARYQLLFDERHGLVKVQYLGALIRDDPDGRQGRARYRALKLSLSEKYGMPEVDEIFGLTTRAGPQSFYPCLREPGCGWWHATYRHAGMNIRLQLHGAGVAEGFVSLVYESPEFAAALGRYELQRKEHIEEAL